MNPEETNIKAMIREAYATLLLEMKKTANPIAVELKKAAHYGQAQTQIVTPPWVKQYVNSLQEQCLAKILLEKLISASINQNFKGFSPIDIGKTLHKKQKTYAKSYFQKQGGFQSYPEISMRDLLKKLRLFDVLKQRFDIEQISVYDFIQNTYGIPFNSFKKQKVAAIQPDLVVVKDKHIVVLDLTGKYNAGHFHKTIAYALIVHQASKIALPHKEVIYGEIYWSENEATILLRKLNAISMNTHFVKEFPVDPGVMDTLSVPELRDLGRKNPHFLSTLEHKMLATDNLEMDWKALKQLVNQFANMKFITTAQIDAAINQI
ncbi:MAG: hypothetical protein SVR94_06380 [Pseudomonadota bacterium]|nr:hypothetical protein [Pseudomonadota bacterium]